MTTPMVYVLYHANCNDGVAAAVAFKQLFSAPRPVQFIPMAYGDPLPEMEAGGTVFMLDFSVKRAVIAELKRTHHVVVIDHHASAQDELRGVEEHGIDCVFDMSRSGAVLTWGYFEPERDVPPLLLYVQDRDLWHHALPESKAINCALASFEKTLETWDSLLACDWADLMPKLVAAGKAMLRQQELQVSVVCAEVRSATIAGRIVPVINCPSFLASDAVHALLHRYPTAPFAAGYFQNAWGEYVVSLRSEPTRDSVKDVAVTCGGGGHRDAAGFKTGALTFGPPYDQCLVVSAVSQ